jgi:hypothetical protein
MGSSNVSLVPKCNQSQPIGIVPQFSFQISNLAVLYFVSKDGIKLSSKVSLRLERSLCAFH